MHLDRGRLKGAGACVADCPQRVWVTINEEDAM